MKRNVFLIWAIFVASQGYGQMTDVQFVAKGNDYYYTAKDYPDALAQYQSAAQLNPNSAAAFQGIGNCDLVLGEKAGALSAYEKCLALAPNNPPVSALVDKVKGELAAGPMPAAQSTAVDSTTAASSAPQSTETAVVRPAASSAPTSMISYVSPVPFQHLGIYLEWGAVKETSVDTWFTSDPGYDSPPAGAWVALGCAFEPAWSVQVQWMELVSEGDLVDLTEDRIVPEIKWTLISNVVMRPFVLAGAGLEIQTIGAGAWNGGLVANQTSVYPDGLLGAGLQSNFNFFVNFFGEVQCNFFLDGSGVVRATVPIGGGLQFDF